jgi:flagellar M-ring protein FliF
VLPKPSIFKKLAAVPTASVVLHLSQGARLGEDQIVGIQSLVAGSVEGLNVENVTVVDQHSKVLSDVAQNDEIGRSEGQLTLKKEVEAYLTGKAQSMLAEVLGPDRAIVRVDATLNFEQLDREREIYDPNATVVRSEERAETNDTDSGASEESVLTNYEINRTVERIVGQTGGIDQLSVAVFVDGTYTPTPEGESLYAPLPSDQLDQIRRIVQTAIGIDATRGDRIEVVNIQFNKPPAAEDSPELFGPTWIDLVSRYGSRVLLLVVLGVLAFSLRHSLVQLLAPSGGRDRGGRDQRRRGGDSAQGRFAGLPELEDGMIEDVQDYAAENPERIADFVQSWIYEQTQKQDEPRSRQETPRRG